MVLAARQREKLEQVADEVRALGAEALVVEMDLGSTESITQAFTAAKEFAPIHILVNNAGITRDTLALRMKPEDWNAVIQTNLTGSFLCIQQVLQGMMRERWGRIINISSVVAEASTRASRSPAGTSAKWAGGSGKVGREPISGTGYSRLWGMPRSSQRTEVRPGPAASRMT